MTFSLSLQDLPSPAPEEDWRTTALRLLRASGYLAEGYDPKTPVSKVTASVPFRLFETLVRAPDRTWSIEQLQERLQTSPPTVYRHLGKLHRMGLLDTAGVEGGARAYHLAHFELPLAWEVTAAHVRGALARNARMADLLAEAFGAPAPEGARALPVQTAIPFWLTVGTFTLERQRRKLRQCTVGWLEQLGYLDARGTGGPLARSMAFRLFWDCLLPQPQVPSSHEALASKLHTSKPSVGRHLHTLESMMLIERVTLDGQSRPPTKGYRIRYGDLRKAWQLSEAHAHVAMQSYKENILHLSAQAEGA